MVVGSGEGRACLLKGPTYRKQPYLAALLAVSNRVRVAVHHLRGARPDAVRFNLLACLGPN
jgi:hypothetical protein